MIKVAGAPPAVTLAMSLPQIDYGTGVTLSGQINSKKAGENVQLSYQPYGQGSETVLATVVTGADGIFSYNVTPKILTTYRAKWKTASSLVSATAVAPSISFGRLNGFLTRVYAGRSMARKQVQLQRFSASASGSRSSASRSISTRAPASRHAPSGRTGCGSRCR